MCFDFNGKEDIYCCRVHITSVEAALEVPRAGYFVLYFANLFKKLSSRCKVNKSGIKLIFFTDV